MEDADNQAIKDLNFKEYKISDDRYAIPEELYITSILGNISRGQDDLDQTAKYYKKDFNRYMDIMDASDADVPMLPYTINDSFIPVSISARFYFCL